MVEELTTRDEFFRTWGPLQPEAMMQVFLDYINELREEQGMPEITEQQFIDRAANHLSHLEKYDWMKEE